MLAVPASAPGAYPGLLRGLHLVLRDEGVRGLFRGLVPALAGVSHGALQFMFYEELKQWRMATGRETETGTGTRTGQIETHRLTNVDFLLLSGAAKIGAGAITYPYRVVQTRVQNLRGHDGEGGGGHGGKGGSNGKWHGHGHGHGLGSVVLGLWRGEGVRGFYKGLAPNLLRVLPSTCITFLVYENARRYLA